MSYLKIMSHFICLALFVFPGFLHAEEKPEIFVQAGHSSGIASAGFSSDGRFLITGSADKTLKLWEASTGKEIRTFLGHEKKVAFVALSPDSRYVLSSERESNILKLWEVSTGREIRSMFAANLVQSLAFSPDGRHALAGSYNGMVSLLDVTTGKELGTFKVHAGFSGNVNSIAFSQDGRYALSGSDDKTVNLWEVSTGIGIRTFTGHTDRVVSVALSRDGRYAVSGSADMTLRLWDMKTGGERSVFKGHEYGVGSVAFSPDSKYILSSIYIGGEYKLWDVATGKEIRSFKYTLGSSFIDFSPDGRSAIIGEDNGVTLFDITTGTTISKFTGNVDKCDSITFSPDGNDLLLAYQHFSLWNIATGKVIKTFKDSPWQARSNDAVAFSPDGKYALSGSDTTFNLWDIATGEPIKWRGGIYSDTGGISAVAISPDGKYALRGGVNGTLSLIDISNFNVIRSFTGHREAVRYANFSPDGAYIISCSNDGTVKLWQVDTGNIIWTQTMNENGVGSPVVSPDRKYVAYYDFFVTILWDIAKKREARRFSGHTSDVRVISYPTVTGIAFSPDSSRMLTGDFYDRTITLWNVSTGRKIKTFTAPLEPIRSMTFSPNGKFFVIRSYYDAPLRVWDVESGKEIVQFVKFNDEEWIVITPEGYFNASPNGAKHINVRIGNSIYDIDQFYAKFYRPELVQLALAGKEIPKGETIGDIAAKKPAPSVQITSPLSGTSTDKDSTNVTVKVKDNGGGIGSINVYLNGSQVANETRGVTVKGKESANEKELSFTVPLMEGKNEIRVIAFNQENSMESNPVVVSVISNAVMRKPNIYALVVGINEYKNKSISLTYAASDAKEFAETLKKTAAPLFDKTEIQVLTTPDATTKEAITRAFEELYSKIKPNDLFIFYDASHGVVDVVNDEEQYYLLTSNVLLLSSRHIGQNAMSQKELAKLIGNIPAQKKVVILDTCNAGRGGREIQVALLQQTRGLTDSTAVKLLQRAIGSAVFSASSDTQLALEGYKGHGLFTYVLLEGLKGKADIKKDGYITVLGLADYVEENVIKLSEEVFKRQQTPTIQTGANFPIGKVK